MHKPYIISSFKEDLERKTSLSSSVEFWSAQSETEEEWKMKGGKRGMWKLTNEERWAQSCILGPFLSLLIFSFFLLLLSFSLPLFFHISIPFKIFVCPFVYFIFTLFFPFFLIKTFIKARKLLRKIKTNGLIFVPNSRGRNEERKPMHHFFIAQTGWQP